MTSSKREREYERRRYEKWVQRQAAHRARRRRLQVIVGSVLALALVGVAVVAAVSLTGGSTSAATPTASVPASTPAPTGTVPDASLAQARTWTGAMTLNSGTVDFTLDGAAAPQAVASFVTLAQAGFFNGTTCHRLNPSMHILQCGDPTATGTGGPGYSFGPIENAPADGVYPAGTIAMARTGNNGSSMGSQFFFVYADTTIPADTAGGYTVFGHITSGTDVLQAIADAGVQGGGSNGLPASTVTIEGVETQ